MQHNSVVTGSVVTPLPDHVNAERSLVSLTQDASLTSVGEEKAVVTFDSDIHLEGEEKRSLFAESVKEADLQGVTRFPLQASHTPSTFDTTEEWEGVKDYLWLLGYPYSKSAIVSQRQEWNRQLAQGKGVTDGANTNNLWGRASVQQLGGRPPADTSIIDPRAVTIGANTPARNIYAICWNNARGYGWGHGRP